MLVRGVVDDEVDEHADAALLGAVGELDEIAERAVARIDAVVVGDVVAVVALRRGLERHQPDRGDAEPVQVVEPAHQAREVADAVAVGIHVGADRQAVDDRVLVPEVIDHRLGLTDVSEPSLPSPATGYMSSRTVQAFRIDRGYRGRTQIRRSADLAPQAPW